MYIKDKQFFANILNRISMSVDTVNERILAHQQRKVSTEAVLVTVALEQLAMQHQEINLLVMLIADPAINADSLPEPPKKIIGFN